MIITLLRLFIRLLGEFLGRRGSCDTQSIPKWLGIAQAEEGFREIGINQGIERYIKYAHCGELGDPWCAVFVNAMLELSGIRGTRSAMARSFERDGNFIELDAPALGAITTMWRKSPSSGLGHVFFYVGENERGVYGIAGNEDDGVRYAYHDPDRIVGYFWPYSVPKPQIGPIEIDEAGCVSTKEV